ncbi:MAG: hypothetical protein ABSC13_06215 [Dehalococcoidia bacterium]|jgi:hypothetical protein
MTTTTTVDQVAVGPAEAESIAKMLRAEAEQDRAAGFSAMPELLIKEAIGIEKQVEECRSPILVNDSWHRLYALQTHLATSHESAAGVEDGC